jgi:four helix bundle protein
MKARTKQFAIRVVNLVPSLPTSRERNVLGNQLLRCGSAVAANYRADCRSRSKAEFIAKMSIVIEQADETIFWLECYPILACLRSTVSPTFRAKPMRSCHLCRLPSHRKTESCIMEKGHENRSDLSIREFSGSQRVNVSMIQ